MPLFIHSVIRTILLLIFTSTAIAAPNKRKLNLPPAAELHYSITAMQKGFPVDGKGWMQWQAGNGNYSAAVKINAMLVGQILEQESQGKYDARGLAPMAFTEQRLRKKPAAANFDRQLKQIRFSENDQAYALKQGEQDQLSVIWQLSAMARSAPKTFKPGAKWSFPVAGPKKVSSWDLELVKQEPVRTPLGEFQTMHITKRIHESKDEQVDIWLAPELEWYPVKLRIAKANGDYVEQTLEKLSKK